MIFNKLLDGINKGISKGINKGYQAQQCELCGIQFSMIKLERIHRCKRCLKYICAKCGKQKCKILQQGGVWSQQPHRVCKKCKDDFDIITHTIAKYDLKWSNNSLFAQIWICQIKSKDYDYSHFLKLYYKNQANYQQQSEIIVKDVIKGRTDYTVFNYSMKQFLYTIQQTYDKTETRNGIARVLYAIAAKFDRIGYCQGMSGIVAFLLCFSSEEGCFQMFCDLLQHIYPANFFSKSYIGTSLMGLLAQISFLQQYFIDILKKRSPLINKIRQHAYTQSDYDRFRMIIQLSATKCLLSLFVSTLSFSNTLFIWQELSKKKSFKVIERAFLATLYTCRQQILEIKSFQKLEQIFQSIDHQYFVDAYFDMDIDQEIRKELIDKFYTNLSNKWQDSSSQNVRGLMKSINFNQKQIKLLQSQLCPQKEQVLVKPQQFIKIVSLYYKNEKKILHEDDAIFQINQQYLSRIFKNFDAQEKGSLDFRQFVCCLSVCCKGTTKQRLCAIINTFQDKSHCISSKSFNKLVESLLQLSPIFLKNDSLEFKNRMDSCFKYQQKISVNELYILLNDEFINQLSFFAHKEQDNVLEVTIKQFKDKYGFT